MKNSPYFKYFSGFIFSLKYNILLSLDLIFFYRTYEAINLPGNTGRSLKIHSFRVFILYCCTLFNDL